MHAIGFIIWLVFIVLCTWGNMARKKHEKAFGPKSFIDRDQRNEG